MKPEKDPNECLHCSSPRVNGIHCERCRCLIDMINTLEAYAGSPYMCKQLTTSLLGADVLSTEALKRRGETINVPKLVGLAGKLRAIELNNNQNGLLGSVLTRLNKRHLNAI